MSNGKAVENFKQPEWRRGKAGKKRKRAFANRDFEKGEVIPFTDLTRIRRRYTLKETEEGGYRFGALRICRAWKIRARLLSSILR